MSLFRNKARQSRGGPAAMDPASAGGAPRRGKAVRGPRLCGLRHNPEPGQGPGLNDAEQDRHLRRRRRPPLAQPRPQAGSLPLCFSRLSAPPCTGNGLIGGKRWLRYPGSLTIRIVGSCQDGAGRFSFVDGRWRLPGRDIAARADPPGPERAGGAPCGPAGERACAAEPRDELCGGGGGAAVGRRHGARLASSLSGGGPQGAAGIPPRRQRVSAERGAAGEAEGVGDADPAALDDGGRRLDRAGAWRCVPERQA